MGMQISDLMNQYQNNLAAGSEISTKTKGVEQLVKTVSSLTSGQIFEGTVNSIKGGQVILGLSSGQNIMAKLDKGVSLSVGESVFFQVKSNEGNLVQIKPISIGTANNPTLLNALDAGGIPVNEKTLNMANAMMKEQMPIDAKSLSGMYRQVISNPGADPATVVTMNKMGIPVTEEMARQFQNYSNSEGEILRSVGELSKELPALLTSEDVSVGDALSFLKGMVDTVLAKSGGEQGTVMTSPSGNAKAPETPQGEAAKNTGQLPSSPEAMILEGAESTDGTNGVKTAETLKAAAANAQEGISISKGIQGNGAEAVAAAATTGEPIVDSDGATVAYQIMIEGDEGMPAGAITSGSNAYDMTSQYQLGTAGHALSREQYGQINDALRQLPQFVEEHRELFDQDGNLSPGAQTTDILKAVNDYFAAHPTAKPHIHKLIGSEGFGGLIKESLSKEWTLDTAQLTDQSKIDELYRKIADDADKIARAAKTLSGGDNPVAESASSIRDNVDFLNQVNQMYTYVQLPLRMNGESATGDLYVYQNKKSARDDDGSLSAFLHFDLEHLGSTDISVRMKDRNVSTKFYMEDDISFNLIQN
ncbi:MAG: hypothetical protein J6N76_08715, partial [Lachnospiraceae bacterium]|nr:hypothetical protein [Lachnospiraceae bacterium]